MILFFIMLVIAWCRSSRAMSKQLMMILSI